MFKDVSIEENKFVLEWDQSNDKDNDLLGYRVYISTKSRGWNYNDIEAPKERVKKYFWWLESSNV